MIFILALWFGLLFGLTVIVVLVFCLDAGSAVPPRESRRKRKAREKAEKDFYKNCGKVKE